MTQYVPLLYVLKKLRKRKGGGAANCKIVVVVLTSVLTLYCALPLFSILVKETNICAVCGQELVLQQDEDDDGPEKTYKLSCGHLYP